MDTKTKVRKIFLLSSFLFFLSSCPEFKQSPFLDEFQKLKEEVSLLKVKYDDILIKLKNINSQLSYHEIKLQQNDVAYIIISDKGYTNLNSNFGIFFIRVEDIKPYANGYKLSLSIGNPYFIRFIDFKFSVEWGKEFSQFSEDNSNATKLLRSYEDWKKSLNKKDISFTEILDSGCWTRVEIILSPASKNELGHIALSNLSINKISMMMKKR